MGRNRQVRQRRQRRPQAGQSIKPPTAGSRIQPGRLLCEAGKSLPAALITLAVGSLLLTPFLSFVSARSLGSASSEAALDSKFSSDAGIEFAIWSLQDNPTFRTQADSNVSIPQTLGFPGNLNNYTPSITVTALPLGSWTIRQSAPADIDTGGSLAYAGGNRVYSLRGDNSRDFGYYNISSDTWHSLANAPGNVSRGGALVYGGGNFLYALQGGNQDGFWRYNINTKNWASMEDTPQRVRQGGELVYTGGDHIYAFRGNDDSFWRYSISSDNWTSQANAPDRVSYGSELVFTGSGRIYAFRGNNSADFWRYTISSDSWSSVQPAPDRVSDGGNLAYHGGSYLYALQGRSNVFWRYTIATDSWTTLSPAPGNVGRGADLVFNTATTGFASRGGNEIDFWEFEVTPPRYDIHSQAGSVTTDTRIEINGLSVSVLFWDID